MFAVLLEMGGSLLHVRVGVAAPFAVLSLQLRVDQEQHPFDSSRHNSDNVLDVTGVYHKPQLLQHFLYS